MQYCIFPMTTINITNRYSKINKHSAWDIAGEDGGKDYFKAPCDVVVLAIKPSGTNTNCIMFGSVNINTGEPMKILCEDGVERVLTFACSHMDNINSFNPYIGKIYKQGEKCYLEGTKGLSYGNHIHLEVAENWQYNKSKINGEWIMNSNINPTDCFVRLKENKVKNLYGYTMKIVNSGVTHDFLRKIVISECPPYVIEYLEKNGIEYQIE